MFGIPLLLELAGYFATAFTGVSLWHNATTDEVTVSGSGAAEIEKLRSQLTTARVVGCIAGASVIGLAVLEYRQATRTKGRG